MFDGYAHSPSRPPALPDAAEAMEVASRMVMAWCFGSKEGWRERKYALYRS